jgi:FtsX-like permease family
MAVAAVTAIGIGASQVSLAAAYRLTAELNAHWRGAYDVLVRPKGASLGLARTDGLVEPNFLSLAGSGGISEAQVDAIRAIPGVQIAAPIAWVGLMQTPAVGPTITVPTFPSKTTLYSVTLTASTNDGVLNHLVYQDQFRVLLQPKGPDGQPDALSDYGDFGIDQLPGLGPVATVGTTHFLPAVQSPILAVDPVAERALLGNQGAFLDPLIKLTNRDDLTAGTTDANMVLAGYNQRLDIAILQRGTATERARPVLPILVSSKTYATVNVAIQVSQIGHSIDRTIDTSVTTTALEQAEQAAGQGLTPIGSSQVVVSGSLRPFRPNGYMVPWPGTSLPAGIGQEGAALMPTAFSADLTGRPTYTAARAPGGTVTPAFRVTPLGPVPPGGPAASPPSSSGVAGGPQQSHTGTEQSYRALTQGSAPIATSFVSQGHDDQPFVFAPIAEYDLSTLNLPHDPLDYVPYGSYDPPDTSLVADPSGQAVPRASMSPTLNPVGLLQVPPMGIVDIHAAELLRGPTPIDAVRVRVGGITAYSPVAVAKVERVAQAIANLGLDVDVVAASSPQAVDVYVPAYNTSANPPADLGWVEQHWTTLGATPLVARGLSSTDVALLLLALFAAAVLAIGTQVLATTVRTREAGILSALGWRRRQIVRWQGAEALTGALIITGVGTAVWLLTAREPIGLIVAGGGGALFAAAGVAAAMAVRPTPAQAVTGDVVAPAAMLSVPVIGLRTYALRSVVARPMRSLVIALGLAVAASAIAPAVAVLVGVGAAVGPTALASALSGRLAAYQLALLGLIGASTLTLALLAMRTDIDARRFELRVLIACGWRPRDVRRLMSWARLSIAVPSSLLALVISALIASPVAGSSAPIALVAGLAGALAFFAVFVCGALVGLPLHSR